MALPIQDTACLLEDNLNHLRVNFVQCRQINLQHNRTASAHMAQMLAKLRHTNPIFLIQEPYLYQGRICNLPQGYMAHHSGTDARSAIVSTKEVNLWFCPQFSDRDQTTCIWKNPTGSEVIYITSIYMDITNHDVLTDKFQELVAHCKDYGIPLVAGADTNAHSHLWGSNEPNRRGETLEEFI